MLTSLELPDATIIAASSTDPPAFAAVFDRHWTEIHRYCVSRAPAAGEDLAAETFRVAFDERAQVRPALRRRPAVAVRHRHEPLRRHFRTTARRGVPLISRALGFEDEALGRVEAQALGPELAAALQAVASADRDALLLHAWADLTYTEIAHATGVPVGTVRSRIHRARTLLRAHLEETRDERA